MDKLDIKFTTVDRQSHPFYILGVSRLPVLVATVAGCLAFLIVCRLNRFSVLSSVLLSWWGRGVVPGTDVSFAVDYMVAILVISIVVLMLSWGVELRRESVGGSHTAEVQDNFKIGMLLFLASEAMLFFPFFWAFFHGSLSPLIFVGNVWPPIGISNNVLNPYVLPLANTCILLTSGAALVTAHKAILVGYRREVQNGLFIAILFSIAFSWCQYEEYRLALYTINDSIFGSSFFMLTGLHGFHVLVGTCLLLFSYWLIILRHDNVSQEHHIMFECAAWYWHFVDVVWLLVFASVYIWGAA